MKIITDIYEYSEQCGLSLAIGTFDGVHIGHRAVIAAAVSGAGDTLTPAVFTFAQSPGGILSGRSVGSIDTQSIKKRIIESLGVGMFITPPFLSVREMLPAEFANMLKKRFNVMRVCCGFNFRFGRGGEGTPAMLKSFGEQLGFSVTVVPPVMLGDEPVSSTRIRERIAAGDIAAANEMLCEPFGFDFEVIEGDHRGHTLGCPTINQRFSNNFVKLRFGVYAAHATVDGRVYKAVSNIGIRPTVGSDYLRCETHIIGYDGDLYGRNILVNPLVFLRDEQRFESLEALKRAIECDIQTVAGMIF